MSSRPCHRYREIQKCGKKSITEQGLMNEYDTSRYALRCAERRDLVPDSAVYVRGSCALLGSLTRPRLRGGYLRGDSAPSETRRCFGWAMVGSSRARRGPRRGHGRHVARGRRTRRPRFTSTRLARITQFERARNQGARDLKSGASRARSALARTATNSMLRLMLFALMSNALRTM